MGVRYSERAESVMNVLIIVNYVLIAAELEGSFAVFLVSNCDGIRVISGLHQGNLTLVPTTKTLP